MAHPAPISAGACADRLRADIDAGRTGDKIPWPDPAAAPLGTDDEAAGILCPPDAIEAARAYEIGRGPYGDPDALRRGVGMAWWLGIFALIVGTIVGWAVLAT
jgi:hypothetical protein